MPRRRARWNIRWPALAAARGQSRSVSTCTAPAGPAGPASRSLRLRRPPGGADRPEPEPAVTKPHLAVPEPHSPADREVEDSVAGAAGDARTGSPPPLSGLAHGRLGKVRPGPGQALSDPVGVVTEDRITLVVTEAEPLSEPPCRVLLQVRQRIQVGAPADPVEGQVVLTPPQRWPTPGRPGRLPGAAGGPSCRPG